MSAFDNFDLQTERKITYSNIVLYKLKKTNRCEVMQCPYFKKVNFHRIQQRRDSEEESEKYTVNQKTSASCRQNGFQSAEQSIPEEGFTNNIKVENYNKFQRYDGFNSFNSGEIEEYDKIITIKMPKSLKIKQLNIQKQNSQENLQIQFKDDTFGPDKQNMRSIRFERNQDQNRKPCELSEIEEEELGSESSRENTHKEAKVFSTHRNLFFQTSFYGVILLSKTSELCFCSLDQNQFKILLIPSELALKYTQPENKLMDIREHTNASYKVPKSKIKYFVDLKKYKLTINNVNATTLNVAMIAKGSKQSIHVQFMSQVERCTFECVFNSILDDIVNTQQYLDGRQTSLKYEKSTNSVVRELKSERSIDSLKFQVQRMSYREIVVILQTFDIILFKGKNLMCKMQRFFTNSNYDHVGLVIRTIDGSLLLLQATGNIGVAIYSFSSIEMALKKKLYQRIAIRKFSTESKSNAEKNSRLRTLQEFIREVNGKKYKFDPMYLISSSIKKKSGQISKEETYFCSELVAEALKICGIMKKSKPSYKYLPKHFGDAEELNDEIMPGYYYSDPIILEEQRN